MSHDAARLEALGATEVTVNWRGRGLRIPLRLEDWPLGAIRGGQFVEAVDILLAGQHPGAGLVVDDYRLLSDVMAQACGVGRLPETPAAADQWFGGVMTLLRLLDRYEDDVASDLRRFWNIDYARRWAPEDPLTMRQIWVYVRRCDPDSAVARADNYGKYVWREPDYIAAGIYSALTGEHYPGRPYKPEELEKALEAMRVKAAHVDKLKASTARYAPNPPPAAQTGPSSALAEAVANRRRELGIDDGDSS